MLSKYAVKEFFRKNKDNPEIKITLDEKEENLVSKETGIFISTIDEYLHFMRKKFHCDFELVYEEHVSLIEILRCKECGTVIFTTEDNDYDPRLCCPTCGGYNTWFEYWTADDIKNDPNKQEAIQHFEQMQKSQIEAEKHSNYYDYKPKKKFSLRKMMRRIKEKLTKQND